MALTIQYGLDSIQNVAHVYGYSGTAEPGEIVEIATTYAEKPVTSIQYRAFENCSSLANIIIPNSITLIGSEAFKNCTNLTNISISSNLASIDPAAFDGCTSLQYNEYDNAYYLGNTTNPYVVLFKVKNTDITSCEINSATKVIYDSAFANCSNLSNIVFPAGLNSIGDKSFENCIGLTNILLPAGLYRLNNSFYNCTNITSIRGEIWGVYDVCTSCNSSAYSLDINGNSRPLQEAGMPEFSQNSSIIALTIQNIALHTYDHRTFANCTNLAAITIGEGVPDLTEYTFYNCKNLTDVIFTSSCELLTIADYTFEYCSRLQAISLPDSLLTLGFQSFAFCTNLATVNLNNNLKTIGNEAFRECTALISIDIPDSVEKIVSPVFSDCNLTSVSIGKALNSMPVESRENYGLSGLFAGQTNLTAVTIRNTANIIPPYTFASCSNLSAIVLPDSITAIYDSAFKNCSSLALVTLPSNLTIIEDDAFSGCSSLTNISIPSTIEKVGAWAFYNCTKLVYNEIDNGKYLGNTSNPYLVLVKALSADCVINSNTKAICEAFAGLTDSISTIVIPDNIISIAGTFSTNWGHFTSLHTVTLPEGLKYIGSYTFDDCTKLANVNIPSTITTIDNNAFSGCKQLTSCDLSTATELTYLGSAAFMNSGLAGILDLSATKLTAIKAQTFSCTNITNIILNNQLSYIGYEAFEHCSSLTNIVLPDSITIVDEAAFTKCYRLKSITFPAQMLKLGLGMFEDCTKLTSVKLPNELVCSSEVYTYDMFTTTRFFSGCKALTTVTLPVITNCPEISTQDYRYDFQPNMFTNCDSLLSLEIPLGGCRYIWALPCKNLQTIKFIPDTTTHYYRLNYIGFEPSTFASCKMLSSVYVDSLDIWSNFEFENATANPLWHGAVLYINNSPLIDLTINTYGYTHAYQFTGCTSLKTITIPADYCYRMASAKYTFSNCTNLDSLYWGSDLESWLNTDFATGCLENTNYNLYINNTILTDVIIPAEILKLRDSAFDGCKSITSIVLHDNVTELSNSCLRGCINLVTVQLGTGITEIPAYTFYNCSALTNINISNNISSIGKYAFSNCASLATIDLSVGTASLGTGVFSGCTSLTTVSLPANLISIPNSTFRDCSSLAFMPSWAQITEIGERAFEGCSTLSLAELPTNLTWLGDAAFRNCTAITISSIPNSVTSSALGLNTFAGCTGITTITIPDHFTSLRSGAFSGCTNLQAVILPNNLISIGKDCFLDCVALLSLILPDSLTTLEPNCFKNCSSLTTISLPKSVITLGEGALLNEGAQFQGCTGLTTVTFDEDSGLYNLSNDLFNGCSSLATINLPKGLVYIGSRAFYNCTSLQAIILPNAIDIESDVFSNCTSLATLSIPKVTRLSGGSLATYFTNCNNLQDITVKIAKDGYTSDLWTYLSSETVRTKPYALTLVGDSETKIYSDRWAGETNLTRLTLTEGISTVNSGFRNCTNLQSIEIKNPTCYISTEAFKRTGVTTLTGSAAVLSKLLQKETGLSSSVATLNILYGTTIEDNAFSQKSHLTTVNIGSSILSIGDSAFQSCDKLMSITIPDSVTSIGAEAFKDCYMLTSVTIGNNITTIRAETFAHCSSLTNIAIPDSVTSIGDSAFYSCYDLASITLGNNITTIGDYAFNGCKPMYIDIPDSVTSIGSNVFYNEFSKCLANVYIHNIAKWCNITFGSAIITSNTYNLYLNDELITDLILPSTLTELKDYTFANVASITSCTLPNTVTTIGTDTFRNTGIKKLYLTDLNTWLNMNLESEDSSPLCNDLEHELYVNNIEVTELVVPDLITNLKPNLFKNCTHITKVTLPSSITTIDRTFTGCTGIDKVYADSLASWVNIEFTTEQSNPIYSASALYVNNVLVTDLTIDDTINNIKSYCFINYDELQNLNITSNSISIGDLAFKNCQNLEQLAISSTTFDISATAFENCTNLNTVAAPISVIKRLSIASTIKNLNVTSGEIDEHSIYNFNKLEKLTIGENVTRIYGGISSCAKLTTIEFNATNCEHSDSSPIFTQCPNITTAIFKSTTVTKIPAHLFEGCTSLTTVEYSEERNKSNPPHPPIVESIGVGAFKNCTSLTSVEIPASVKTIGSEAFYNCYNIDPYLPWNIETIGSYAFYNCANMRGTVEFEKLTTIGSYAFYNCAKLESLLFNTNSTSIDSYAFENCSGLAYLSLGDGITSLGYDVFYNCSKNLLSITTGTASQYYVATSNCLIEVANNKLILGCRNSVIPNTVNKIATGAFYNCDKLATINIPDSVTDIYERAFEGCIGLTSCKITDLEKWCQITFYSELANPLYYARRLYLNNTETTNLVIPESITTIKTYTFINCRSIKQLSLPTTLTSIGHHAFKNIDQLVILNIPDSVTYIENDAYRDCISLIQVTVGTGLNNIGSSAFEGCFKLVEVINKSSLNIRTDSTNYGHIGCYALNCVKTAEESKLTLDEAANKVYLYTKDDNNIYAMAINPATSSYRIGLPDNVTEVYKYAFYLNADIISFDVNKSLNKIGEYAFAGCTKLDGLGGGNNNFKVVQISSSGYYYEYLIRLSDKTIIAVTNNVKTIPDNVLDIVPGLFMNRTDLTTITIPNQLKSIPRKAFENCSNLTTVNLGLVNTIDSYAFNNCTMLNNIMFNSAVNYIANYAFTNTAITEVEIPNPNAKVLSSAFSWAKLTKLTLPENLTDGLSWISYYFRDIIQFNIPRNAISSSGSLSTSWGNTLLNCMQIELYNANSSGIKLNNIASSSFSSNKLPNLQTVVFHGTQEEYAAITIESDNDALLNATIVYTPIKYLELSIDGQAVRVASAEKDDLGNIISDTYQVKYSDLNFTAENWTEIEAGKYAKTITSSRRPIVCYNSNNEVVFISLAYTDNSIVITASSPFAGHVLVI